MGSIRGKKKLTSSQMKLINKVDKSIDVTEWMYEGEEYVDDNGNKCAAKNSSKSKYLKIINRNTGEIKRILI